jgi:outer membrane receptor for ferrienterochelin and colicins
MRIDMLIGRIACTGALLLGALLTAAPARAAQETAPDGPPPLRVVDAEAGTPLPGAHVRAFDLSGRLLSRSVSDIEGRTPGLDSLLRAHGRLVLAVSYVGFAPWRDTVETEGGAAPVVRLRPAEHQLDHVVVTAQMGARPAEDALHRVRVIDQNQLDQMAARDLEDALQQQTGMRIQQDAVLGSSVSIQGLSGEHVNIMVDGVPLVGRQNGSVDLQQLPMAEVERIEIIEGPLSVQYGSDAMAGTINIITQEAQHTRLGGAATVYGENNGTAQTDFSLHGGRGRHRLRVGGTFRKFDGWRPDDPVWPELKAQPADQSRTHRWDPRTQYQLRARYRYQGDRWRYGYRFHGLDEEILNRGAPLEPYQETAFDDVFHTRRLQHDLTAEGGLGERWRYEGLASLQDYRRRKNTFRKDLTTLNERLSEDADDHDTTTMRQWMARGTFTHYADHPAWEFQMGYDARYEHIAGGRIAEDAPDMHSVALFGAAEWAALEGLTLRPGLRWMYHSAYAAPATPSLKARYQWGDWGARASYAHGFRAPGLRELHFYFVDINHFIVGNPALEAENSRHYHASIERRGRLGGEQGGSWKMSLSGFHNRVDDQISLAMVDAETQRFSYVNTGRYRSQGLEWEAALQQGAWRWSAAASYVGRYNQLADQAGVERPYRYSPQARLSVGRRFGSGWRLSSFYTYQGVLDRYAVGEDESVEIREVEAYGLLDAQLQKGFGESGFSASLGCKNLLDVTNVAADAGGGSAHGGGNGRAMIGMGRTFYIRTQWQWQQNTDR